jgi:hypothetical protein
VATVEVYVETAAKRVIAGAIDYPGWARGGKTEDEALAKLIAYRDRYAPIARRAGHALPRGEPALEVVERVRGGATTDFGAPEGRLSGDADALTPAERKRLAAFVEAAWATFDEAAVEHRGKELAKGPRGGGRALTKIVAHVLEAEEGYLGALGSRRPKEPASVAARVPVIRALALEVFEARATGAPLADPARTQKPWTPRFWARRSAWHALDHAWEIEDRVSG